MTAQVALCLAAAARLEIAFQQASRPEQRQLLLLCAVDCLDKTLPLPEMQLYTLHWDGKNQSAFLVKHRQLISALPVTAWPKRRVRPSQWPQSHANSLRTVEKLLKGEALSREALEELKAWLAPAVAQHSELEAELTPLFTSGG